MAKIDFSEYDVLAALRTTFEFEDNIVSRIAGQFPAPLGRALVVQLSAALQRYFEMSFWECSEKILKLCPTDQDAYMKTFSRWGNPNNENIKKLFARIGIFDIFGQANGMSRAEDHKKFLVKVNDARNMIAHGKDVSVSNIPSNQSEAAAWREEAADLCECFEALIINRLLRIT